MSNVLQYTLGLSATGFVHGMEIAHAKLSSFMGSAAKFTGISAAIGAGLASIEGMTNVFEGVTGAIEKGAALEKLHKVTGESVSNLFLLQKGLSAAGLSAEGAGDMVFKLQKSLGGINEEGVPTGHIFSQLGLSIDALKGMDAPAAIQTIANSLDSLDNASAASAAGSIFGRGSAKDVLALARSTEEFSAALKGNAAAAALMSKNAKPFEEVEKSLKKIKNSAQNLFLGIAAGAAPGIQAVMDQLNGMNLTGLGEKLSIVAGGFIEAFKEGRLMEVIALSISTGFEVAFAMLPSLCLKLGIMLLNAFKTPLTYIQAVIDYVRENGPGRKHEINWFGGSGSLFKEQPPVRPFSEVYESRQKEGFKMRVGGGMSLDELSKSADKDFNEALKWSAAILANSFKTFESLNSKLHLNDKETKEEEKDKKKLGAGYKMEHTSWEKIGLVMRGHGATDHAATTARNTSRMADQLQKIIDMRRLAAPDYQPGPINSHA